ncbi:OsmC family peroxiredoxin [Massilia arenosa]|uniref:OsmC family peroxiredoxin n=1 Tax=Zemynaea arenosa TaxID=2561931 RepID=A0A4Y9RUR2_9BURK|nr:OsmC family protein [Massilia arenosa]TFW11359.1 OsmC family peroxiredoxin [Massilia arenosa]
MKIAAVVKNSQGGHSVEVRTDAAQRSLDIPAKAAGGGSAVNGGEFLMLALATCFCNDLYREAAQRGIVLEGVEVTASADFPAAGLAAENIRYSATVRSSASEDDLARLIAETDKVAEVHNTLRAGVPVQLMGHLE